MVKIVPRNYSGEANNNGVAEEPGKWLKHFEKVCRANDWDDDEEKIDQLPLYLEGKAADWCEVNSKWLEDDE